MLPKTPGQRAAHQAGLDAGPRQGHRSWMLTGIIVTIVLSAALAPSVKEASWVSSSTARASFRLVYDSVQNILEQASAWQQKQQSHDIELPHVTITPGSVRTVLCSYGADGDDAAMSLGRIYTGALVNNGSAAEAYQCIALEGDRIAGLGSANDVGAHECKARQGQDASACTYVSLSPGHSIVPGLHDAHGHLLDLGWARSAVDLVGAASIQDVVQRIEEYIKSRPDLLADETQWIPGLGWDQTKWDPPVFPTASNLSNASPLLARRRIVLRRIDVHALWLSQAALDAVEAADVLPPAGEDVEGGLVVRDDGGKPNGCFIDKAMDFVYKVAPPWTDDDRSRYLETAAQELLSLGITSVGDAAVDLDTLKYFARCQDEAVRQGRGPGLPLRIYAFLACPPDQPRCVDLAREHGFPRIAQPFTQERLTLRTVKLFADGALGSWGSAMWEPYSDRQDDAWRGLLLIPDRDVQPLIRYWVDEGWNVATHCIGDRAQTIVLDAYEKTLNDTRLEDPRFRIEHAQLLRASDIPRFGELGVIASMQPTHCTSDMGYVETRIGRDRAANGAYPWQSLLKSNATLVLGSDFPVELPNVMHGIYSAVTRKDPDGHSPHGQEGWYPKQRLTRAQALHGFSATPAYAQFEEQTGGTLQVGKRADLAVLNRDVVREYGHGGVPDSEIRQTRVLLTMIDGRVVWQRAREG